MVNNSAFQKKRLSVLARVIFFYLCSLGLLMFASRATKSLPPEAADLFSILLASLLTCLLVFLFARWEKLRLQDIGVVPGKSTIRRFTVGYLIGLSMAATQAMIALAFGHLRFHPIANLTVSKIILTFVLYLFVACREELVFRSYPLRSLDYSFSSLEALIIITVIFIQEHVIAGMSWKMAIIGSGLGGILFGVAALKTKGLALPLGLHSAWNFGQWIVGFKNKPGIWNAVVEKGYENQTENISFGAFVVMMVLAITGIMLFYKQKTKQERRNRQTAPPE